MTVKNKTVLVTGAASGIGKEIAFQFAREGARICVADIDYDAARITAHEIGNPAWALPLEMDVTDEDQVNAGIGTIIQHFGAIDVLISNAGIQHIAAIVDLVIRQLAYASVGSIRAPRFSKLRTN